MAVVVVCMLVLALQAACGLAQSGVGQSLPRLQLTGEAEVGIHTRCDDCSDRVAINISFPFGDYCHDECYIGVNGVIAFGEQFLVFAPEAFPGTSTVVYYGYLVAPFWADADLRMSGTILWETHELGQSDTSDAYLSQVSEFIENREDVSFAGNWMMLINYDQVPPYSAFIIFFEDLDLPNNTYQVILITDGRKSYAIYTYQCGEMDWGDEAVIGFNGAGDYYDNYNISDDAPASRIACLALPEETNNIVYDLVPNPSQLQCESATPAPPTSLGTCRAAGYETCCVADGINPCFGAVAQDCFCDPSCRLYGDCCRDIDETCPPDNFTIGGNETYLLFANSFHINRVTLDGSSFEIVYTDTDTGGIVGLDYHYSQDYMYWSDVSLGTLNRAHLNGSNPEVLLQTEDPVVDDIAVDWVNSKLYWTEATLGDVVVMDIESRRKTKLIVNTNGATTRAIAVDPTTRYMYWTDWGTEARIERAGMDGRNRTILHDTNLVWPNGLTIDYANQRIYWVDASLDTIEYSNVDGSGRTLLDRMDDQVFHPFSITLEEEFIFWTDWNQLSIFTTHKDLPNDNIVNLYGDLVDSPHGIEAVTPDRQQEVANPCDSAECNPTSLCLLSPSSPEGYTCVCTDEDEGCVGPTPFPTSPPPSESGSCVLAGYTDCCEFGSCRGVTFLSGEPSSCTCDAMCTELRNCCYDVVLICPEIRHLCSSAGHAQCCPAGAGCVDVLNQCSCDADCLDNNNCCTDALYLCYNKTSTPTPTMTSTSIVTKSSSTPTLTSTPSPTPTPTLPPPTQVPGRVVNVQAVNTSFNELRISWSPSRTGGRAELYRVTVEIGSGMKVAERETGSVFALIDDLTPEVPYYITVEAVNSLGTSDPANTIAFTREGVPSVPPMVNEIEWTSLTELKVSWEPLTLEQARGFITAYLVSYSSEEDERRKRSHDSERVSVPGEETSVTLMDLDSKQKYSISVAAETAEGQGVPSVEINAPDAGTIIQLQFLDIPSCIALNDVTRRDLVDQIIHRIVSHVSGTCTQCQLAASDFTNGLVHIDCNDDMVVGTFRTLLLGSVDGNEQIIEAISKWVEDGGTIEVKDFLLKLNSECEVVIETLNEPFCRIESTPNTTPPDTTPPATMKVSRDNTNVASIVVPIVIIVLLIAIVIAALIAIILFRRNKKQRSGDPYLNFDEQESSGTARLSQNLYTSSRRDYENPIYGEHEDTKVPLEREYLEDPSILK